MLIKCIKDNTRLNDKRLKRLLSLELINTKIKITSHNNINNTVIYL